MALEGRSLTWPKIAGLGVGLVVAGQFAGWNYGLGAGGWSNMCAATMLVAGLCFGLSLCVAELAVAIPNAGGLYVYCEAAFGRFAGFIVGIAIFTALTIGTGTAAEFLSAYAQSTFGFGGLPLKIAIFLLLVGIHIRSVGEAMTALLVAGAVAVVTLLAFGGAMAPSFDIHRLLNDSTPALTFGGIIACIPFAIVMFISIEQTATAAEESLDPTRDVPRGIFAAIMVLLATAACVLVLGPAAAGPDALSNASDPLAAAMAHVRGVPAMLGPMIGLGAILGLVATLFSLIFSASRQLFALAREGLVPPFLARTNRAGSPYAALLAVGLLGFPSTFLPPERVMVIVVLFLSSSYVVVLASFIRLRLTRPDLARRYRTPGGIGTGIVLLALALLVFAACLFVDISLLPVLALFLVAATLCFVLTRRRQSLARTHPNQETFP